MEGEIKNEFGPELIVKVYNKTIGLEGFLVVDNTALGPGKGGIRMTPDITEDEVAKAFDLVWREQKLLSGLISSCRKRAV